MKHFLWLLFPKQRKQKAGSKFPLFAIYEVNLDIIGATDQRFLYLSRWATKKGEDCFIIYIIKEAAMVSNESQLVAGLHLECHGISPDVPVHVVKPKEFIQKYTDVVALGDNVFVERARLWSWPKPIRLHSVFPSGLEDFENRSIPREEAEQKVQAQLDARAKLEQYQASPRLQRTAHFIKRVLRQESAYLPKRERGNVLDFPEIILFGNIDGRINEIVVDRTAEEAALHASSAR